MKPAQALAWLRPRRIATLVPTAGPPSLVAEIAGGPIRGSWWAHPKGKEIFAAATALEEAENEVVVTKLIEGKVTFVHRALWPALVTIVGDSSWRRRALNGLDPAASALYTEIGRRKQLVTSKAHAKARGALEDRVLVHSRQVHTDSGRHETIVTTWQRWAEDRSIAAFAGSVEDAIAALREAANGARLGVER